VVCRRTFAIAAVALLAGCGGSAKRDLHGTALLSKAAPNFTLHDQAARTVTMAGQQGRWVVVTFLYTHCPDVCPLIATHLNGALRSSVGRRAGLQVLAVSVDPAGDTPTAIRHYVAQHRLVGAFRFLIGSRRQLARVWHAYYVAALPGTGGTVAHSTVEFLIDPRGRERLLYDKTITTAELVQDLRTLTA
jgi:protein SCO1/2